MADKKKIAKGLAIVGGIALVSGVGALAYQQYKLADKLCYSAGKFQILNLGLTQARVQVQVNIENKGELEMELKNMSFDVYANNVYVATVDQTISTFIAPFSDTSFPIQIQFSPRQLIGSLGSIIGGSSLDNIVWKFKGKIRVKKWGIPLPLPFNLKYTTVELKTPNPNSIC